MRWKWSIATERNGIPIGWEIAGANRNDCVLLDPTLDGVDDRGLLVEIDTLHVDRGYDHDAMRRLVTGCGIDDLICSKRRPAGTAKRSRRVPPGMRWPIERTNSWLSNFGQLRRNTDRFIHQPRSTRPGHRPHHHDQAHQVGRPLESEVLTIGARSLS
jgi:hypothetical protein